MGLLIFLHFIKILAPVENVIISLINPVADRFYSLSSDLRVVVNEQTDKRDLLAAVRGLEVKVNELIVENSRLRMIEEENRKLRQQLKFQTKNINNYSLANVVSRGVGSAFGQEQVFVIDKGEKDGLSIGLAVLDGEGIIVGKTIEVQDSMSKVCLVTDSACKLAGTIQSQGETKDLSNTSGIVEGDLGLTMKMNFIPQTESISVNEIVVTSGLEKDIPAGLVIGRVTQIDDSSNEVWKRATIESLVDLNELTIVSVLLPPAK